MSDIKVTLRGATTLKHCPDCESEHIGLVPCGRTFRGRLRSVKLDSSITPTRTKRAYYDDEPLKETFGYDRKERRELYADDTKGKGAITGRATPDHIDAVLGKEDD